MAKVYFSSPRSATFACFLGATKLKFKSHSLVLDDEDTEEAVLIEQLRTELQRKRSTLNLYVHEVEKVQAEALVKAHIKGRGPKAARGGLHTMNTTVAEAIAFDEQLAAGIAGQAEDAILPPDTDTLVKAAKIEL